MEERQIKNCQVCNEVPTQELVLSYFGDKWLCIDCNRTEILIEYLSNNQ